MKARYRKTGEIVTIVAYSGRVNRNEILDYVYYIDSNGKEHTEDGRGLNLYWDFDTEIDNPSTNKTIVDWDAFRREVAKEVLPAVIAKKSSMCGYDEVVKEAIKFSKELIKQLKKQ